MDNALHGFLAFFERRFPMARENFNLNEQAKEILKKAQERGVEHSYMFLTTFKRYQEHLAHLVALEKAIKSEDVMVTKEYVKGRSNLYVNPAITSYNQTAGAADKTAQVLLKCIIQPLSEAENSADSFDVF
jgi:hypothetical protein